MSCEHEALPAVEEAVDGGGYNWHCRLCDERWPIEPLLLNLGSGDFPERGYVNIDMHSPANIMGDFTLMDFHDVDEVLMSHILEHFSWRDTGMILSQVHSWMKPGAKLTVEVPDGEKVLETALESLRMGIKVKATVEFESDNWVLLIYGAQIHDGEYHKSGFTEESLKREVERVGFQAQKQSRFPSMNAARVGYPCLRLVATA